jgi:transcriptional regulator of acetoin/glycerol metabolism
VLERAVLLARSDKVKASDLGLQGAQGKSTSLDEMDLDSAEALLIRRALARNQGNALLAAKALGLSRSAFYRRLQKHKIEASD